MPQKNMNKAIVFALQVPFNQVTITFSYRPSINEKFSQALKHFQFISLYNWMLQKLFFFPNVINERNKPNPNTRTSSSHNSFRNAFLKFLRSVEKKVFNIYHPFVIKMLRRLAILSPTSISIMQTEQHYHWLGKYFQFFFCVWWEQPNLFAFIW